MLSPIKTVFNMHKFIFEFNFNTYISIIQWSVTYSMTISEVHSTPIYYITE